MSIEAVELLEMRDGVPAIAERDGSHVIALRISCGDTAEGVAFIEWLRDAMRAQKYAAMAFAVIPAGAKIDVSGFADRTGGTLQVINEGDPAPTADVIALARTHFDAP